MKKTILIYFMSAILFSCAHQSNPPLNTEIAQDSEVGQSENVRNVLNHIVSLIISEEILKENNSGVCKDYISQKDMISRLEDIKNTKNALLNTLTDKQKKYVDSLFPVKNENTKNDIRDVKMKSINNRAKDIKQDNIKYKIACTKHTLLLFKQDDKIQKKAKYYLRKSIVNCQNALLKMYNKFNANFSNVIVTKNAYSQVKCFNSDKITVDSVYSASVDDFKIIFDKNESFEKFKTRVLMNNNILKNINHTDEPITLTFTKTNLSVIINMYNTICEYTKPIKMLIGNNDKLTFSYMNLNHNLCTTSYSIILASQNLQLFKEREDIVIKNLTMRSNLVP